MPNGISAEETRTLMTAGGFGVTAAQRINEHLRSLGFERLISPAKAVRAADAATEVTGVGVYETTIPGGNEADGIQRAKAVVVAQDALQLLQLNLDECLAGGYFRDMNLGGYGFGNVFIMESQGAECEPASAVILVHQADPGDFVIGGRCERKDGGFYFYYFFRVLLVVGSLPAGLGDCGPLEHERFR